LSVAERLGLALLHRCDPERAHGLSIAALKAGLVPLPGVTTSPRLRTTLAGLELPNPVGLAAGFDKNAQALAPLSRAGFGFLEVGAATPRPQPGNPRPRLFRLTEDAAVINRFGFNNDGMEAIAARLAKRPAGGIVGLNLGANKDSADRAGDFAQVLGRCGPHVDFATVNVSSPNTEKLRDLQGKAALSALLAGVMQTRAALPRPIPVFLKIAPDLGEAELAEIAEVALASGLDAIIATNTTLSRDGLKSPQAAEAGGLSGAPLFTKSTRKTPVPRSARAPRRCSFTRPWSIRACRSCPASSTGSNACSRATGLPMWPKPSAPDERNGCERYRHLAQPALFEIARSAGAVAGARRRPGDPQISGRRAEP
jgi:dihydroorotate dehydrogenase